MSESSRDAFYIGYLPNAPRALAPWLRAIVTLLFVLVIGIAYALTTGQGHFDPGCFEFGEVHAFEGTVKEHPYPTLLVDRPGDGPSAYLLSTVGKMGAQAIMQGTDGKRVRLEGTLIFRDDQTMVEVVDGSVEVLADAEVAPLGTEELGVKTFVGEIVDSKCFLGVMKPGRSKPHKACAIRCISGGAPPILVVTDDEGVTSYLLLTDADGRAVNERVLDLVAVRVEITGQVVRTGDQLLLRADPSTYKKLR